MFEPGKNIYFSTYPPPTLYICPIALPMRRNLQHRSILTVVSITFALLLQPIRQQRTVCHPVVNRFTQQTLPTVNRKHFFTNMLRSESFFPTKTHNIILLFGNTLLDHRCHFDYWNQPLNVIMHFCYLDWHEAGLCCYLVIQIENVLLPLQLFYFHLWPIYWLSIVVRIQVQQYGNCVNSEEYNPVGQFFWRKKFEE
jgi:hypothetical protein